MNDNTVYDPVDLVRELADKIGIHQLYAIVRDMRGEPEATTDIMDNLMKENEKLKHNIRFLKEDKAEMQGEINGLRFAIRCNGVSGGDVM